MITFSKTISKSTKDHCIDTKESRLWVFVPVAHLGKYLLHFLNNLAKHGRLLDPHPVRAHAESKSPGAVKRILRIPLVSIVEESIVFFFFLLLLMNHSVEEWVPELKPYLLLNPGPQNTKYD